MTPSYLDAAKASLVASGALCLGLTLAALGCEYARLYNSRTPAIVLVSLGGFVLLLGYLLHLACKHFARLEVAQDGSSVGKTPTPNSPVEPE